MNYGKSNLSRRKKRISSKKRMKKKRVGVRLFKAFVLCILLLGIVGVAAGGVFVKHVIDNTPEVTAKDILPQGYTTSIVDQNGTVLEQLKDSDSNRVYKKYDEISKYMGKIQYLLASRDVIQLDPVYTDKVELMALVPVEQMKGLKADLMEGTNGQVVLDETVQCWFAQTEDGIRIFSEWVEE